MISAKRCLRATNRLLVRCSSLFFTPRTQTNADFLDIDFKAQEAALAAENVPSMADFAPELKIFRNIVRPDDVCNLFLRPDFTDIFVTALAQDCPVSGRSEYQVVSKSPINDSKLMFADTVIEWMQEINSSITKLLPIPAAETQIRYTETERDSLLETLYSYDVWSKETIEIERLTGAVNTITPLEHFFEKAALQGFTLEKAASFLLSKIQNKEDFAYLFQFAEHNGSLVLLSYFATKAINHTHKEYTTEKGTVLRDFLLERAKCFRNDFEATTTTNTGALFLGFDPQTLDSLVHVMSLTASSVEHISVSKLALVTLLQKHQKAPLALLFESYLSSYIALAEKRSVSREEILRDLAPLKAAFVSVGLSDGSFLFLLEKIINSTYDLSHFLKTATETSPAMVRAYSKQIISRLRQLQRTESITGIVASVQLHQVGKTLLDVGMTESECHKLTHVLLNA